MFDKNLINFKGLQYNNYSTSFTTGDDELAIGNNTKKIENNNINFTNKKILIKKVKFYLILFLL